MVFIFVFHSSALFYYPSGSENILTVGGTLNIAVYVLSECKGFDSLTSAGMGAWGMVRVWALIGGGGVFQKMF